MRNLVALVLVLVAALVSVPARAQDAGVPDGGPHCAKETVRKMRDIAEKLMKISDAQALDAKRALDTMKSIPPIVRKAAEVTRCTEPTLSPADLKDAQGFEARAAKWADAEDRRLDAEEKLRAEVVVPICEQTWVIEQAQAAIAREKSNPSGVVDLRVLHDAGADIQRARDVIAQLSPAYVTARKRAFREWQSEGACLAAADAAQ